MSLFRFVGLLLFVSADVRKGLGQTLEPRCSNPQGVYVVEEGSAVEVCFTVFQGMVPQMVTFAIKSTSNLGATATGRIDFMNDTVRVNINNGDQDMIQLCPVIEVFSDGVIERTEYFTVSLRVPEGADLASCQVAIVDTDGGPSDCYDAPVTDVSLAQIINDRTFCFTGESTQCSVTRDFNPNITTVRDCTRWNHTAIKNVVATDILVQDQILPTVSNNIGSECAENVISAVSSLYRAKIPLDINRDLGQECVTNCVLTVSNSKICDISVLLLEDVFRGEVINFLNDLAAKQTDVCVIGLECCGQSQPLPAICGEAQVDPPLTTTVTVQNISTVPAEVSAEDNTETSARGQASAVPLTLVIILAAVLGSILGLILVGGAVAMIICLVLCRRRSSPLHKDVIAAIQVEIGDHQMRGPADTNEYASIVDRESAISMNNNTAYMCSSTHGQDNISTDYNVAYHPSNRVKHEVDHDNVYEYI